MLVLVARSEASLERAWIASLLQAPYDNDFAQFHVMCMFVVDMINIDAQKLTMFKAGPIMVMKRIFHTPKKYINKLKDGLLINALTELCKSPRALFLIQLTHMPTLPQASITSQSPNVGVERNIHGSTMCVFLHAPGCLQCIYNPTEGGFPTWNDSHLKTSAACYSWMYVQ